MRTRKSFRVIQGGRRADASSSGGLSVSSDATQLLLRAGRFRKLLSLSPDDQISGLVDDMEEAISALQRLELNLGSSARRRAAEYRALIAEIDAEILVALGDV